MSQYKLVYYSGMNMNLVQGASEIVEADSFNDALSLKCSWPVFEARDHLSAAAQNPGTCVYYTEMWEAVLMDRNRPPPATTVTATFPGCGTRVPPAPNGAPSMKQA